MMGGPLDRESVHGKMLAHTANTAAKIRELFGLMVFLLAP
jgi:hypothetical protein